MKACALIAASLVLLPVSRGEAQSVPASAAIEITYADPANPLHRNLHDVLRQHEALEKVQAILSPFRLPRTVAMKVQGCNGEVEAWYENAAITVCYEYLEEVWRSAPNDGSSTGIDRIDAIVGPLVDVFLHEFGHALFDVLAIPVLGREEDAADQVAAFLMLQFQPEEARRLIRGTAHLYRTWVRQGPWFNRTKTFADVHGTPAQRFYNLLCIAYGADPELFRDTVEQEHLPRERAENCADEYRQVAYAVQQLIRPHVDEAAAKQVLSRRWLPGATPALPSSRLGVPAKR
jgi:hypothetical protein